MNNVSLTSEIVLDYRRSNFELVTSPPEFMIDSVYLMNHSEVQKENVEAFNTQNKEILLVVENLPNDDDSLNLQHVSISNKVTEKEKIREGTETSQRNTVDINLSFIWSELLQDSKDLDSKFTTFPPWKIKTRVTSCELRVQTHELRVQIHELQVRI